MTGVVHSIVPGRDVDQERRFELGQHVDGRGRPPVLFLQNIVDALPAAAKHAVHVTGCALFLFIRLIIHDYIQPCLATLARQATPVKSLKAQN